MNWERYFPSQAPFLSPPPFHLLAERGRKARSLFSPGVVPVFPRRERKRRDYSSDPFPRPLGTNEHVFFFSPGCRPRRRRGETFSPLLFFFSFVSLAVFPRVRRKREGEVKDLGSGVASPPLFPPPSLK